MTAVSAAMAAAEGGLAGSCRELTNLADISRLLHEVVAKERAIDGELEQQLGRRGEIEKSLLLLNSSTAEVLELMQVDAEQLQGSVANTADLADRVSSKVRELDVAGSAVEGALSRIKLVIDRSSCIDGVKGAMESEDYEAAARFISTYMHLNPRAAALEQGQGEDQTEVLEQARTQLATVVRERFRSAANKHEHAAVVRFTKLYVPLSLHTEGMQAFTGYLVHLIAGRATEDYSSLADAVGSDAPGADFVGVLTNLFKDIAVAVEENEALLRECFGVEGVLGVMQELQAECDAAGSKILRRYLEHRHLQRLVKEISGSKQRQAPLGSPERQSLVDPRQVESFLDEIVMISQRSEEYNGFMLGKLRSVGGEVAGHAARENVFRGGQFNCTAREVTGYYITMEEYYVEEMVNKAIELDELTADQLVSSLVDDTFFIMQKCARRALATGSLQCCCALLTELNNILASGFRAAVAAKLANAGQRVMAAMPNDPLLDESGGGSQPPSQTFKPPTILTTIPTPPSQQRIIIAGTRGRGSSHSATRHTMSAFHYALRYLSVVLDVLLQRWRMRRLPELASIGDKRPGATVVVTGPTSGIGTETAAEFARRGYRGAGGQRSQDMNAFRWFCVPLVWLRCIMTCVAPPVVLACRSLARGENLKADLVREAQNAGVVEPDVQVMELDLASLDSVRRFSDAWEERGRHIDILVNNAGVFAMGAPRSETCDGMELHLGTNYLACYLLTLRLLPSLRQAGQRMGAKGGSQDARVVMVSSKLHELGSIRTQDPQLLHSYTAGAAYAQSKLAQVMLTAELRRRIPSAWNVGCYSLHPGNVMTDVVRTLPVLLQKAYRLIMRLFLLTTSQGARCTMFVATDHVAQMHASGTPGYFDSNCTLKAPSAAAQDTAMAKWLWDFSAETVNLPTKYNLAA